MEIIWTILLIVAFLFVSFISFVCYRVITDPEAKRAWVVLKQSLRQEWEAAEARQRYKNQQH